MVVGAICLVAVALLLFFLLRVRLPHGFIIGFQALDEGGAVIVWRGDHELVRPTSWVTRIDPSGRELWTRWTPEAAMAGGSGPLSIVDGAVVVRYGKVASNDESELIANAAIAFDLADGRTLWDRELVKYTSYKDEDRGRADTLRRLPLFVSDLGVGKHLVSFSPVGKVDQVASVVARTGELVWQRPAPSTYDYYEPAVVRDVLSVLHFGSHAWMMNAASGEWRHLDVAGSGCVIDEEYITVEHDDGMRLLAYRPGMAPRVIAEPFGAFGPNPHVEACGRYDKQLIFLVRAGVPANQYSVVITDLQGQRLREIVLGGPALMGSFLHTESARNPLAGGDLPRYVPYPEATGDSQTIATSLLMLDLETGTITQRAHPDRGFSRGFLFRAGSHWIWSYKEPATTIAVFDGRTGRLVRAVTAHGHHSIQLESPRAVTSDTLWLHGDDRTTSDAVPLAALDVATLQPRFSPRGIAFTDATEAVREKLGLR